MCWLWTATEQLKVTRICCKIVSWLLTVGLLWHNGVPVVVATYTLLSVWNPLSILHVYLFTDWSYNEGEFDVIFSQTESVICTVQTVLYSWPTAQPVGAYMYVACCIHTLPFISRRQHLMTQTPVFMCMWWGSALHWVILYIMELSPSIRVPYS